MELFKKNIVFMLRTVPRTRGPVYLLVGTLEPTPEISGYSYYSGSRFAFMVCVLSSFEFPGEEDNLCLATQRCRAAGGAEPPEIPNNRTWCHRREAHSDGSNAMATPRTVDVKVSFERWGRLKREKKLSSTVSDPNKSRKDTGLLGNMKKGGARAYKQLISGTQ